MKQFLKKMINPRVMWAYRYYQYPQFFDIVGAPLTFKKDGLYTKHNSDTLQNPLFVEAYKLAKSTGSFQGAWGQVDPEYRAYIYCWSAFHCKGGMARAAIHYTGFTNKTPKKFYLLDTYEGTPSHCLAEDETHRNQYEKCYDQVVANFKDFQNVVIVQGEVPATLSQVVSDQICFLSLDMNALAPEIAAIEYFWPKLSSGAVVVLDDYNNIGHERQKRGFDEFCKKHNKQVLSLPTGQGLIFK
jgi:O-methyltransferase